MSLRLYQVAWLSMELTMYHVECHVSRTTSLRLYLYQLANWGDREQARRKGRGAGSGDARAAFGVSSRTMAVFNREAGQILD